MRVCIKWHDGCEEFQDLPEATPSSKFLVAKRWRFRRGVAVLRTGWLGDGTPRFTEDTSLRVVPLPNQIGQALLQGHSSTTLPV